MAFNVSTLISRSDGLSSESLLFLQAANVDTYISFVMATIVTYDASWVALLGTTVWSPHGLVSYLVLLFNKEVRRDVLAFLQVANY